MADNAFSPEWYKEYFGTRQTSLPGARGDDDEDEHRKGAGHQSLAAHTPSPAYAKSAVEQRILQLVGVPSSVSKKLSPAPYESKYPFTNKLLDALIAARIDPITKPASLNGDLDRMPVLKDLAHRLADSGYLRKYPGGGIGIGGGGGSDGSSAAAAAGVGASPAGSSVGDPGLDPGLDPGAPPAEGQGMGRPATSEVSQIVSDLAGFLTDPSNPNALMGDINPASRFVADFVAPIVSLIPGPVGPLAGFAMRGQANQTVADIAALGPPGPTGPGGVGTGGGFGISAPAGSPGSSPAASGPSPSTISPTTRANAAARVGGGISPAFLEALQSLRGGQGV